MTLHEARTAARDARVRHDEYLDHLRAQGQSPTVEQRNRLDSLQRDVDLYALELDQEERIVAFRRLGVSA